MKEKWKRNVQRFLSLLLIAVMLVAMRGFGEGRDSQAADNREGNAEKSGAPLYEGK